MNGTIFDSYLLEKQINELHIENIEEKIAVIRNWAINFKRLSEKSEKKLQPLFFKAIFEDVLDYNDISTDVASWSIEFEENTEVDASTPDAILGDYTEDEQSTYAVIELKGFNIDLDTKQKRSNKNYGTPVDQGYSYAHKYDGCQWIIVSNMLEMRIYKNGISQNYFERFYLNDLESEENFKKFYLLLNKDSIVQDKKKSKLLRFVEANDTNRIEVTKNFYTYYSKTRTILWESLRTNNPQYDKHLLLEKVQKILNRLTFIQFCEANKLLKFNTLRDFYFEGKSSKLSAWKYLETLFEFIDKGDKRNNINRYNGGLFREDKILNSIILPDKDFEIIEGFFDYDFKNRLTIDILGHIFEQSISDIESLKGIKVNVGDRKANGIFYTPEYITSYIVKEAIDKWLENEKTQLGFNELKDWKSSKNKSQETKEINRHKQKWVELKKSLNNIKVLDAACGSGAFLIKVFEYLVQKQKEIQKEIFNLEALSSSQTENNISFDLDIDREILKNNIYGIDLNKESVEITKLSLWLQTANSNKPLTTLDENIIVGNTIVDEDEISIGKIINWNEQFTSVMKKGGFDIIVGNPPYIPIDILDDDTSKYYQHRYKEILKNKWDTSVIFMYRCAELLNPSGLLSMIVPRTWLTGVNYIKFRQNFFNEMLDLYKLVLLPKDIFEDAYVDTCIFIGNRKNDLGPESQYLAYSYNLNDKLSTININDDEMNEIPMCMLKKHDTYKVFANINAYNLYFKIKNYYKDQNKFISLDEITDSTQGPVASQFNFSNTKSNKDYLPYLINGQGYRYRLNIINTNYINFSKKTSIIKYYTKQPRLYCRRIVNRQDRLMVSYLENDLVTKKELNPFIVTDDRFYIKYVYALLNSKLLSYIYINFSTLALKDDYRQTTLTELRTLPIKIIDKTQQDIFVEQVEKIEKELKYFYKQCSIAYSSLEAILNEKLNQNLKNFYEDTPSNLLKNSRKLIGASLNKKLEKDLYNYYMNYAKDLKRSKTIVLDLDNELDTFVYSLYKISEFEIKQVEEYYSKFKNSSSLFSLK